MGAQSPRNHVSYFGLKADLLHLEHTENKSERKVGQCCSIQVSIEDNMATA